MSMWWVSIKIMSVSGLLQEMPKQRQSRLLSSRSNNSEPSWRAHTNRLDWTDHPRASSTSNGASIHSTWLPSVSQCRTRSLSGTWPSCSLPQFLSTSTLLCPSSLRHIVSSSISALNSHESSCGRQEVPAWSTYLGTNTLLKVLMPCK